MFLGRHDAQMRTAHRTREPSNASGQQKEYHAKLCILYSMAGISCLKSKVKR